MKTGTIIYVAGNSTLEWLTSDLKELVCKSGIKADRLEIITRTSGNYDIHDAWWRLVAKGMQLVLCLLAEVDDRGELRLTGRQMRLCG